MQLEEFTVQLKPDCRRANNTMVVERKSTAAVAALNIPVFPPPNAHVPVPVSQAAVLNGRHAQVYLAQRSSGGEREITFFFYKYIYSILVAIHRLQS